WTATPSITRSATTSTTYGPDPSLRDRTASPAGGVAVSAAAPGPRDFAVEQWPLIAIWSAAILVFGVNAGVVARRVTTSGVTVGRALILAVLVIALVLLVTVLVLGYRHYVRTAADAA
ncbi:MAG: hypothetical protein R3324_15170, partial [Halobacteriales archaeon]|nr:hypothetical protein [Halobacteriales archaeon]